MIIVQNMADSQSGTQLKSEGRIVPMETIMYQSNFIPAPHFVIDLYRDAEWFSYTENEEKLLSALNHSLCVVTAWDGVNLVGLVRAVGDGETILYIQDILVRKSYRRQGIGRSLIDQLLEKFPDVRQKVLLTDDAEETRAFYVHIGFQVIDESLPFAAFFRMDGTDNSEQ